MNVDVKRAYVAVQIVWISFEHPVNIRIFSYFDWEIVLYL